MKGKRAKRVLVLMLAAVMLLATAACGGSQTGSDQKTGDTAAPETQAATTTSQAASTNTGASKTTLNVMSWWDITKSASLQELKEKFEEKNPDIQLDFTMIGSGYATKVLTIVAGGGNDIPDVMMLAADKLPIFASSNAVIPLDRYVSDEYRNSIYPMTLEACKFNGQLYAVSRDVTSMVMYFNKAMFADAGVALPEEGWTVNDFLDLAKKMTKVDANGKSVQWGYYFAKFEDTLYDWILLNGGDYATPDGSKSLVNTPETKAGLQFMQDLIYKYKVCPTEAQAKQFGTADSAPIVAGKVAMTIGGLSFSNAFDTANPKVEYAIRPLPAGTKKVTHAFVNTWTIPKGAKNPDLSWRALEFFSGREGQQIALDTNMGLPATKEVNTDQFLASNPDKKYLLQSLEYAVPFRTLVYGADFYTSMKKELELVWLNQKTVDEAAAAIDAAAGDILAGKTQ